MARSRKAVSNRLYEHPPYEVIFRYGHPYEIYFLATSPDGKFVAASCKVRRQTRFEVSPFCLKLTSPPLPNMHP